MAWIKNTSVITLGVLILLGGHDPAAAGGHKLTEVRKDSVDLVASLSWDPQKHGRLNKTFLNAAFHKFASKLYGMTEKHVALCKLYVYAKNHQMHRADLQILEERGVSHASINGLKPNAGAMVIYTATEGGLDGDSDSLGSTMAHEFGHYGFGLYDEYNEEKKPEVPVDYAKHPTVPRPTDVTLSTVMGCSSCSKRLSIPRDYIKQAGAIQDPWGNTAQCRAYGLSAWEVITKDPKGAPFKPEVKAEDPRRLFDSLKYVPVPADPKGEATGYDKCLEIIYMEGTVVALVIDASSSMGLGKEPTRLTEAKAGAATFVDSMKKGDKVVVVAFNTKTQVVVEMTEIDADAADSTVKKAVKQKINAIQADSHTGYGDALRITLEHLEGKAAGSKGPVAGNTRYAVFISDGDGSIEKPRLDTFVAAGVPIYTIGVRAQKQHVPLLIRMGQDTGGAILINDAKDLSRIYMDIDGMLNSADTLESETLEGPTANAPQSIKTAVTPLEREVQFRAFWSPGDVVRFQLKQPDGTPITPKALNGAKYLSGDVYGVFRIQNPAKGTWTSELTPETVHSTHSKIGQAINADTPFAVQPAFSGGRRWPEPLVLRAIVRGPDPIIQAQVKASVKVPAGVKPIPDLTLVDDGTGPDVSADDGVYSGVFANITKEGLYQVSVSVTNPKGTARVSGHGALHANGGGGAPQPLGAFERKAQLKFVSLGYKPMPQTPDQALQIANNNEPVWAAMEKSGDVVWFRVNLYSGSTYYLMTSRLATNDAIPMATRMTLYGPDKTTALGSSEGYDNTNISWLAWKAAATGEHYIKVEHPNAGIGRFTLSVGPKDRYPRPFLRSSMGGEGAGEGCCSLSNADSVNLGLVVSFLLLLVLVGRNRRRR